MPQLEAPLISVLMPCYNSSKYLDQAINSIQDQTYNNWELLICNDDSTDNSLELLNAYKSDKIKIISNQNNLGYLKTCNRLFKLAKGDYITFQDSDDYSDKSRLEKQYLELSKNQNLGALGTQFNFMTDKGIKLPEHSPNYPLDHNSIVDSFIETLPFCGASVMIKKHVLEDFPQYNEYWDRIGAEDLYWLFCISEKYKVGNLPESLYFYRHNPKSVTRNKSNPRKIHCHDFLTFLLNQRRKRRSDYLEEKNFEEIEKMERSFVQPYIDNPNFIHYKLADWAYAENNNPKLYNHLFDAIKNEPFSRYAWKTLGYYIKKTLIKK